jgi:uncharacterized RDD family membrane protein YckC
MQVRAHKVRKRRRLDPDSPQLEFADPELPAMPENSMVAIRAARWKSDGDLLGRMENPSLSATVDSTVPTNDVPVIAEQASAVVTPEENHSWTMPAVERQPLPPFPRITVSVPKVIQFPRLQARAYELAEPVADQLRIFEAIEELPPPPPSHLNEIEIAPEEPAHTATTDFEVPIQTAPLNSRAYAAAVDATIIIGATGVFAICAGLCASSLPMNKPLLASGAACVVLLVTIYYFFSLCFGRGTVGMQASAVHVLTFSGAIPSRATLAWRALATVLSGAALGMGFAWALIDEDQLCWHDRITHTYLTSK